MKLMIKTLYSLLALIALSVQSAETNTHRFFNDALSIDLSTDLKPLSQKALEKRYGKQKNPPSFAFTNKNKSTSFTFTQYQTPANKKSMNKIHKSLSTILRQSNDKATWKKDKVYTRLGTKIAVLEYEIKSVGKYQYNLTYALPINDQLTMISFITTDKKYKNKWLTLARESMESLAIN